jgi:hypothetical protein
MLRKIRVMDSPTLGEGNRVRVIYPDYSSGHDITLKSSIFK